jgi:3-(3-hydroxy-phenyl)propionate hydroxylase
MIGTSNPHTSTHTRMTEKPILIAGGGPVGVVAALALARQGFAVRVFEADASINEAPRAATIHPATLEMLADLDLIDEVIARGLVARTFQFWDRPSGQMIAQFDHAVLARDTRYPFVVQCEQHKLANLVIGRLRGFASTSFDFSAQVTAIEPGADAVAITVARGNATERVIGSYLIGADGGRSTVRKALGIAFEGYTFPERFLVLTTPFDFARERSCGFRSYFSDPDEWANLFKVAGNDGRGLWRVVFPTLSGETDDEVLNENAVQRRLQKFFPKPGAYPVVHRNLYNVHQRVATRFGDGRVFLAGDAAHVNNPIGGLGLNCGIHDAVELANLLGSVLRGEAPTAQLAIYDGRRRPINVEYVQQQTIANKKRLEARDPRARDENFAFLRRTAADPAAHRAFLLRTSLLDSVRQR